MSRALGVIIFQGPPLRHEYYRLTFELLKRTLTTASTQVDKIYLVCNSFNPTVEDLNFLKWLGPGKVTLLTAEMASHWYCMQMMCKQVVEDELLLIDSDTLIYNPYMIGEGFGRYLNGSRLDIATILDSSGTCDHIYPQLGESKRIAPYWCFMKMDILRKTSMNFDPNETHDSMGALTEELLEAGAKLFPLPDDRGTYNIDKTLIPSITPRTGYYHLRNWNGALHILTSYLNDKESYTRDVTLMPINERCRLLAWVWVINQITAADQGIAETVITIVRDWGIDNWHDYVTEFRSFHPWIEEL